MRLNPAAAVRSHGTSSTGAPAVRRKTVWTVDQAEPWLAAKLHWIVAGSLLIAFVLRLISAAGTFLNPDEALHHLLVNQISWPAAYRASLTNAHPPLYFFLLYYWRFIGNSELMLRLPSILASTAAAWMAYRWVNLVLGRSAALSTLLLMSFSPMLTALGAEVRNYSLLLLCMASCLYFLERAFRDQKLSSIALSSLFLYLAILTHYSALWFVCAAGIYVLLRLASLRGPQRIAWMLFQAGGVAMYAWLYVVHISKMRGSAMEGEAMSGWLQALYYRHGENPAAFIGRSSLDLFQFFFATTAGGGVALVLFIAGVAWLIRSGLSQKRRDLPAFGLLLVLPFLLGLAAAFLDLYPFGGTRHCVYLVLFVIAGVSFVLAAVSRQRLLPILLLIAATAPLGFVYRLRDPQQMDRKEQIKELMDHAMEDVRISVPTAEPLFSDYQSSILLEYYLGRDRPPPPARTCAGLLELRYGAYRVVVLSDWSATAAQLTAALDGWRKQCDSPSRDAFWIFDGGWGFNLLDDLNQSVPRSLFQRQHFGETISVFKLRMAP
jgi:hypothetical protein